MTTISQEMSPPRSRIERWRLNEPVRLYLFAAVAVLVAGLLAAGALTGEWRSYLTAVAAILLVLPPAIGWARASVYSAPGVVSELQRRRARETAQ